MDWIAFSREFLTKALSKTATVESCILATLIVFVTALVCMPLTDLAFPVFFGGHSAPTLSLKEKVASILFVTSLPAVLMLLHYL